MKTAVEDVVEPKYISRTSTPLRIPICNLLYSMYKRLRNVLSSMLAVFVSYCNAIAPFNVDCMCPRFLQRSPLLLALQEGARNNSQRSRHDYQYIDIIHAFDNSLKHGSPEIATQVSEELAPDS